MAITIIAVGVTPLMYANPLMIHPEYIWACSPVQEIWLTDLPVSLSNSPISNSPFIQFDTHERARDVSGLVFLLDRSFWVEFCRVMGCMGYCREAFWELLKGTGWLG
jgi:hypothetical protein